MLIIVGMAEREGHRLNRISSILIRLMNRAGIKKIADLSSRVGIPNSVMDEIISGEIGLLREESSLNKLASFFGLTVKQLIGETPISEDWVFGYDDIGSDGWMIIPIIEWTEAMFWVSNYDKGALDNCKNWINTGKGLSKKSFALRSKSFMGPRYKGGSLIIVDPESSYCDGDYILVVIEAGLLTVRRIVEENGVLILRALNKEFIDEVWDKKVYRYFGKIVECRIGY